MSYSVLPLLLLLQWWHANHSRELMLWFTYSHYCPALFKSYKKTSKQWHAKKFKGNCLLCFCFLFLAVGGGTRNQGESSWVLSNSGETLSGLAGHPVIRYSISISPNVTSYIECPHRVINVSGYCSSDFACKVPKIWIVLKLFPLKNPYKFCTSIGQEKDRIH